MAICKLVCDSFVPTKNSSNQIVIPISRNSSTKGPFEFLSSILLSFGKQNESSLNLCDYLMSSTVWTKREIQIGKITEILRFIE